jgi:5-methylcytosine-specific restriction endonuclease McrA
MSTLTKATVLVLNRNWQAINVRTPQEAFCMMAANVATGLEIEFEDATASECPSFRTPHSALRTRNIRPVTWEEWITLPVREQDEAVHTVRGRVRVPTVIVAVNYAKVPKKRPKLCARAIRERDPESFRDCQYTRRVLRPEEGSLDHVVPRSRGGKDAWENLVWSAKEVNQRKADRLPHEAGLRLLSIPRAPRELPVSVLIRNAHRIEDWKLFVEDRTEL